MYGAWNVPNILRNMVHAYATVLTLQSVFEMARPILTLGTHVLNFTQWHRQGRESYTVKPAHAVTSIKQSPVLKGHFFLIP